mgnify:CR=1 FL=1
MEEIQDMVSILRSQSTEYRKANSKYIRKTIKLQMLGEEIISNPKEELPVDKMKDFLDLLIDITNKNRIASAKVEDATKRVLTEIEFKGIDFKDYLAELNQ